MSDDDKKIPGVDDFASQIRSKPKVPTKEEQEQAQRSGASAQQQFHLDPNDPYAAPAQRQVTDPGTGLPIVGRPPLQGFPIGPFMLELPPDPNLHARVIFDEAWSGEVFALDTKADVRSLAAWQASSLALAQVAGYYNQLVGAMNDLWNRHQELEADYQALLVKLDEKGVIDIHIDDDGDIAGDAWQEGPDGNLYARYGSTIAMIHAVAYKEVGDHKAVFDVALMDAIEGGKRGWQLLIGGKPVDIFDDLEQAKTYDPMADGPSAGADGDAEGEPADGDSSVEE